MTKTIVLILVFSALIYGIIILIILIKNYKSKHIANTTVKKISENPAYADKIMDKLHCSYGKLEIQAFDDLFYHLSLIPENQTIGKFQIVKTFKINEFKMLCITICNDLDYFVGITGDLIDIKKVYTFNFAIVKNMKKMQFEFYSEFFDDLNDKNLRSDFETELLKFIVKA